MGVHGSWHRGRPPNSTREVTNKNHPRGMVRRRTMSVRGETGKLFVEGGNTPGGTEGDAVSVGRQAPCVGHLPTIAGGYLQENMPLSTGIARTTTGKQSRVSCA